MIKKLNMHKFIYPLAFIFVLFALVNTVVFAKPPLPPGGGLPNDPGGPGGPDQPGLNEPNQPNQPNQPNLPGQPNLPPCPECENNPTVAPTGPPSVQPTAPPVGNGGGPPDPTATPGPDNKSSDNKPSDNGGTGGPPSGQVLGLAATSSAPYNIMIEGVLALSIVCFALALKGQQSQSLKRRI